MGILERMSTILRANINALLDQAEDPEQMLEQIIRDMRDSIAEARGQVAEMIAQEKLLQADVHRNQRLAADWQGKAELAVRRSADDLAREALRRKLDYEHNAEIYATQLQAQEGVVEKLKRDLEELEAKYDSAVRNREALIARHRRALAQQKVAQVAAQISAIDPASELARMEDRIRREEARALAAVEVTESTLEGRFESLEADDELQRQLEDLKTRVRGQLPDSQATTPQQ